MRGAVLLFVWGALLGCSRKPAEPPAPGTTQGEVAGVRYLERMTGGARPDERVPMIIALHAMGGEPAAMIDLLRGFPGRARLIAPFGHPKGNMYEWYDLSREADQVAKETDRLAATIDVLVAARPTAGKPIVTGFSQGGIMTFALAVTHPESMSVAIPISGTLPPSIAVSSRAELPRVIAFHGADDLAVPIAGARASIAELRRAGYTAELREFPGLAHDTSDQELRELFGLALSPGGGEGER